MAASDWTASPPLLALHLRKQSAACDDMKHGVAALDVDRWTRHARMGKSSPTKYVAYARGQKSGLTTACLCSVEVNAGNSHASANDAWADSLQACNRDKSHFSAWPSSKIQQL